MDNRRPPTDKQFSPRKLQDNNQPKEGSNYRYNQNNQNNQGSQNNPNNRNTQNNQNNQNNQNSQNPNNRYSPREGGSNFRNRDNSGGNNYPPRTGQINRDSREVGDNRSRDPRDNRSFGENRDNRDNRSGGQSNFRPNTGKFVPRTGTPNNNNNPANRFQPRSKFQPGAKTAKPWQAEEEIKIVSDEQVTDGKHKGKYLKNNVSEKARISSRRIREAMFKILSRKVRAGRFLDLCAGSGTIGIEAISRGSINSTFVERSSKMCSFIKKNLSSLEIKEGHGDVNEIEAVPFLIKMSKRRRFWDVVYLDPSSSEDFEEIFVYLSRGAGISPGGVLVVEHPAEVFLPEKSGVLRRWRVVVQGERAISFFERK